ncbi:MAG TPA: Wzz/FepE/Etk N-terminal domain-containing protein [Gemmatimonadales bacterium]|nr:Wzz/FepE/Etk N-terminal domain-containing protein [Gemmatimonadales bacterium]
MADSYYPARQLPPGPGQMNGGFERPSSDNLSLGHIFGVLKRRYRLVLILTLIGLAAGAYIAAKAPATYQAVATIRLAGERRALTGQIESPTPELGRTADPLASLTQLIYSRSVLGAVVDSLGLRLRSATPEFGPGRLEGIKVDSLAPGDTILVTFYQNGVKAKLGNREARAHYGQILDLGPVRFAVPSVPDVPNAGLYVINREKAIDNLLDAIFVNQRLGTDIVDVKYLATSPRTAQRVVNTTVLEFQRLNVRSAKEKSQRRRAFLEDQLHQTDSMLARAQAELALFRSRQQLASSGTAMEALQTYRATLDARASEIEADRSTFSGLLSQMKRSGTENEAEALRALAASPGIATNPTVSNYYRELDDYQYKLDSMTTGPWRAAPTNPDLIRLKSLMTSKKAQLKQAVASHVATLNGQIASLRTLRARSGASLQVLPAMAEEEARLTGRVQTLTSSSDNVRQEYQKARMAEEVEAGDVDIINLADTPYAPVWATAPLKLGIGLLLGLLFGAGGAFLLEALNTSIRKPEDLEVALHVPGLAVIPRLTTGSAPAPRRLGGLLGPGKRAELDAKRPTASSLGTVAQPFSIGVEAFRMLRTSLVWCEQGDNMKTLVVTSAAPGEGKTLTSANLSVTFAYDGLRVLLIDCDVRRPRLHGLFQVPRSPGLMELLTPSHNGSDAAQSLTFNPSAGRTDSGRPITDVIRPTNVRGLSLLTCGALPTNASNLLSGVRMRVLLQELAKSFDLVILDTPPVLATADAGILASLADGVLLVVRAGQTDRVAAKRAHQQLVNVGATIVGTVLNDPGGEVSQYGDYYYPYDYAAERE